jgi:hypothetical protein
MIQTPAKAQSKKHAARTQGLSERYKRRAAAADVQQVKRCCVQYTYHLSCVSVSLLPCTMLYCTPATAIQSAVLEVLYYYCTALYCSCITASTPLT